MRWTLEQVAGVLGAALPQGSGLDPLARLAGVSIDSRTVGGGELFFAIHGPRHDGHDFVAAALDAGALAAVVARGRAAQYPEPVRARLLPVDDPREALQHLARVVLRAWRTGKRGRRLAAVTGSMGKTTTKEILAALVAARFRVLKSAGNLNNEYGLPLTLLRLEEEHDAAVVELGMSRRGELARLAKIAEPDVGVVTNVAPVHLEFFSSVDEIALAKRELIEGLGPGGIAVLNKDDARVVRFAEGFRGAVITFGFGADAQFCAEAIEDRGAEGTSFDLVWPRGRARLELPLAGRHNLANALAALAAASVWDITPEEAREVLAGLGPAAMRGEVLRFEEGFIVLDDCYNSSPVALAATVDLLAATPARRRILAAGEMLELGPTAEELHRRAGEHAVRRGVDAIVGVQGHAAELVQAAVAAGLPEAQTRFFDSSTEAAEFLAGFVRPGDALLVKGSRGVKMERIVEKLKATFSLAGAAAAPGVTTARRERD